MAIPNIPSVRRRVAVSASFMVALRLSFRGIGLASTLILVRLLSPGDFGLVALASLAYTVFVGLSELSFQLAIIRMANPQRIHYDTAWTMGVVRGAVIAVMVIATSPFLAAFIGEPRVIPLSYILGALALFGGFENIALVDFQRSLQYDRIFWYQIAGKIAGVAVTIPAAIVLRNYWALICGISATRCVTLLLGYVIKPYRPRFSLAGWSDLFNFSKWLMVTNVLTIIDQYCMTLTVGRIAGTNAMGIYQVASEIGSLPASEVAAPIRDPIYAGYSSIAGDLELLRNHFLSNLSWLVAVIAPLSLGIFMMADPITALFLGHKWMAAVPLIRLTALYALFDAIGHSAVSIYMTLHRQRRFVQLDTLIVAIRVPAIVIGAYIDGVTGAAIALALTAVLNMVIWNGWVPKELGVRPGDYWLASWRTMLSSAVMMVTVAALLNAWPPPVNTVPALIRFAGICLLGAGSHVVTQYSAWLLSGSPPTVESELLHLARGVVRRVVFVIRRQSVRSA